MKTLNIILVLVLFAGASITALAEQRPPTPEEIAAVGVVDTQGVDYGAMVDIIIGDSFFEDGRHSQVENYKYHPALSPDGSLISFCDPAGSFIAIVPVSGGEAVRVYDLGDRNAELFNEFGRDCPFYSIQDIKFTPDGSELSFQVNLFQKVFTGETSFTTINTESAIESVNIYTGEHRIIVEDGYEHSWNKDGRYLTYIRLDPRIYVDDLQTEHNGVPVVYDTITGEKRYLSDENFQATWDDNIYHSPAFSPDGSHIFLSMRKNGIAQIVKIPFEGGTFEQLTSFDDNNFEPSNYKRFNHLSVSTDGKLILFDDHHSVLVFNTITGKTFDVFTGDEFTKEKLILQFSIPPSSVRYTKNASLSLDGTKFCYQLNTPVCSYVFILNFDSEEFTATKPTLVELAAPETFVVHGNYPNPFNPATTIEYSLLEAGFVTVDIYNFTGQKIRGLLSEYMTPGVHSVVWDGRGDNGKPASSGIYLMRVSMGKHSLTHRMMLVK
ncbi:FlgD immunoglobulin-like domain containing protein [Candidatus Latescibacterota bacterium]